MENSSRMVEEISAEIGRAAQEQANAVRRMMDAELGTRVKTIRRDAVVIGVTSFVMGAGVSVVVTFDCVPAPLSYPPLSFRERVGGRQGRPYCKPLPRRSPAPIT
jgi:hypothetical protein